MLMATVVLAARPTGRNRTAPCSSNYTNDRLNVCCRQIALPTTHWKYKTSLTVCQKVQQCGICERHEPRLRLLFRSLSIQFDSYLDCLLLSVPSKSQEFVKEEVTKLAHISSCVRRMCRAVHYPRYLRRAEKAEYAITVTQENETPYVVRYHQAPHPVRQQKDFHDLVILRRRP